VRTRFGKTPDNLPMTQIDFYFNAPELMRTVQRLIAKAQAAGSTVVVAGDAPALQALDAFLWQQDAGSFAPHAFATDAQAAHSPVLLAQGAQGVPPSHHSLLINMGMQSPAHFARFGRMLELVSVDEANKLAGRERYSFYKQRGYPLKAVDLAKK
jgi:DNA polymerase III subunit chi